MHTKHNSFNAHSKDTLLFMQKSRIETKVGGTISPNEIESLKYEPVENSEDFYVDMGM